MTGKQLLALVLAGVWGWGLYTHQTWARDWWLPALAWGLFRAEKKVAGAPARQSERRQTQASTMGTNAARTMTLMTENPRFDLADDDAEEFGGQGYAESGGAIPDSDYQRIATYLSARLPFVPLQALMAPDVRARVEQLVLEGKSVGTIAAEMAPQGRAKPAKTINTGWDLNGIALSGPRQSEAQRHNRRRIEAVMAGLPRSQTRMAESQTGATLSRLALESALRRYKPVSQMVPTLMRKASITQVWLRRRSKSQRLMQRALANQLRSNGRELRPVQAPSAKASRTGILTGAALNLRTIPPRFVR